MFMSAQIIYYRANARLASLVIFLHGDVGSRRTFCISLLSGVVVRPTVG